MFTLFSILVLLMEITASKRNGYCHKRPEVNLPDVNLPEADNIVGGTLVGSQDVYPWLVAIRKNGGAHCGGSLISPTKVLTAAHCVVGQTLTSLQVLYRRYDFRRTATTEGSTTFKVTKRAVHPSYSSPLYGFDVAVLDVERVSGPIATKFANLDTTGALISPGQPLKIAGWGTLASGASSASTKMYETVVPVTTQAVCVNAYPSLQQVTTVFCAGYTQGGKDACQGDSGGPAFVSNQDGSVTVAGVVSFGNGCALAGYPGAYATVAPLSSWIKAN
ncbi:trypsin-like cysteine/serine peptidase domain-containing protein [Globomyces pollinis-pini]|nr:trypsin-like cysteine/serine peptidase domain-containing protein [Globomyces pollinis-pini]